MTETNQDEAAEAMDAWARLHKRDGETKQAAYVRLLNDDPLMKRLNALYHGTNVDGVTKQAIIQQIGPDAIRKRASELQAKNPTLNRARAMELASSEHRREYA